MASAQVRRGFRLPGERAPSSPLAFGDVTQNSVWIQSMCERSSLPSRSIWWLLPSSRMRWKFSWPGAVLGDPLARELARLDLAQDVLHRLAGLVGDDPLAAREVAVLGRVGDRVAHPGDALLVHQVDDQLELVQALEVGQLRVVARVDERLVARADQLGDAAAEHGLLAEQVGLGLVLERRLDHAAARAADALGVGEREVLGVAASRPGGSRSGRARREPSRYWRRTRWPGPLGATSATSTSGGRLDLAVVDREAVAEQQQVAGRDARRRSARS